MKAFNPSNFKLDIFSTMEPLLGTMTSEGGKSVPAHQLGKTFAEAMDGRCTWIQVPKRLSHLTPSVGVVGNAKKTFGTDGAGHLHLYNVSLKEFKDRIEKGEAVKPAVTVDRDKRYKHPYLQLMEYL